MNEYSPIVNAIIVKKRIDKLIAQNTACIVAGCESENLFDKSDIVRLQWELKKQVIDDGIPWMLNKAGWQEIKDAHIEMPAWAQKEE